MPIPSYFPELNLLLGSLQKELHLVLGRKVVGFYLHGSLACGDFDPQTSDIDFCIVTQSRLPAQTFSALKGVHEWLFSSDIPWSRKLEGAYIPLDQLRCHDPSHPSVPWLGVDGHFAWETLGSDWIIQRWILREKGLVISGPPLQGVIDPISAEDLRWAVRSSLVEWWSPPFPSPGRFQSDEYLAYSVLTMCRSLYVLENGRVATKPQAARWAIQKFSDPWGGLISTASTWNPSITFSCREQVFDFIRFTLQCWGLPASPP